MEKKNVGFEGKLTTKESASRAFDTRAVLPRVMLQGSSPGRNRSFRFPIGLLGTSAIINSNPDYLKTMTFI